MVTVKQKKIKKRKKNTQTHHQTNQKTLTPSKPQQKEQL